jgi:antitoxin VapB
MFGGASSGRLFPAGPEVIGGPRPCCVRRDIWISCFGYLDILEAGMPLYIKDDATARLVTRFAKLRGVSKQDAVRIAVQAELDRATEAVPLRDRFAAVRQAHPLPPATGKTADKAFFDELSGEA